MPSVWEEASECGACGSKRAEPFWSIDERRFVTCTECGVVRLFDRVSSSRLDLLYAHYYPTAEPSRAEFETQLRNPTFEHRRRRIERHLGPRPRRLLEIGCGDGNFLAVMQRAGWQVQGLEFDGGTAALVERRHHIPVFVGDLDGVSPEQPLPVVAAYHVMEHVYEPRAWLQHVRRLIEPKGLLHLQTPNLAALMRYVGGRAWSALVFPEHVYLYTPRTLCALLERGGFNVIATSTWDPWHGPGVTASTLANVVRRSLTGRLPWSNQLQARTRLVDPAPGSARPRATPSLPRRLLDAASGPLARLEAIVGLGGVVDIVAKRAD